MAKYELDMTSGNLFKKIISYTIPIMLTGILQLLYNAADVAVVGKFAGEQALAAVGSTGSLINLIVSLFLGLSVGTSVSYARSIGKGDLERANRVVHTAVLVSVIASLFLTVVGVIFAKDFLLLMDSPEDVVDLATVYMQIYFGGMVFNLLYNFASSVVRANGDSKRPLYILMVAGLINVLLNLLLVIVFKMSAAGVAIATVASQAFSAIAVMYILIKETGPLNFSFDKLKIDKDVLKEMVYIGLPSGIQSAFFSISNVIVQKSVNGFGSTIMAGNSTASNLEGFVHMSMNSVYQATLNFTSQNYGAKKENNLKKVLIYSLIIVTTVGASLGVIFYLLEPLLARFYTDNPEVIEYALNRMAIVCLLYFICGIMDVLVGFLRGVGYSTIPMVVSLIGVCAFRVLWIFTVFESYKHSGLPESEQLKSLYVSYPISWTITVFVLVLCILIFYPRIKRKLAKDSDTELVKNGNF